MQFGCFILNMNKSIAPTVLPKSIIDQNCIKFKFVNPHKDIKDNQNNLKSVFVQNNQVISVSSGSSSVIRFGSSMFTKS